MAYKCEYQNKTQNALWSLGNVNLVTAASMNNGHTKSIQICTNCKNKNKKTVLVFVEYLYDCLMIDNNKKDFEEITDLHLNFKISLLLWF